VVPGVAHAFSTRRADGRADFDMGGVDGKNPARDARRVRFLRAAGLAASVPAVLKQVHGARIVRAMGDGEPEEADGGIWIRGESVAAPSVRSADCVPILLLDREGGAAAAVHAGWRGTAARIAVRALEILELHGVPPRRVVAALGPAILPCCYRVGPDVARAVLTTTGDFAGPGAGPGKGIALDLHAANHRQLASAGVPREAIHAAPWCTGCRADLFYSHRREGSGAGRMMAAVGAAAPGKAGGIDPS